jgi:lambda family phage tail tape measure protein
VLGAGGNVSDSTFAFSAITKAIKATGGSAEQADGAILALTQVFSKGKVSAEELNQIAERLPGTFTLFAKATGRTGPELLKALQDGKVGLNDLMKFLGTIDTQYGQTALRVAASTQDAGARMSIALQDMQLSVGRSLQPVGAALQATFTDFISTTAPAFVAVLKPVAATLQFISADPVGKELAKLTLYMGAATAASLLLKPALAGLAAVLAFTRTQVIALTAALAKNPLTLLAIAATAATLRIAEAILNQKRLNNEVQRTLTLAEKAPASTVATDINATEYALRKARTKAVADSKSDPFGIGASLAGLDVDRLEKKLLKLQRIYKGRIELDTIFKGMDPTAGVPTGYKRINGRLAYLSPGQGYVDAQTGKPISGGFTNAQGVSQETKDKLASSYLQAFDQRAEALAKARETREQAIANIRTKAAEDLLTLERTLGDERRRIEYDIDALRRKTAATERDRQFNLRHQAGEDPNTIDAARAFADINQKAADARAQLEQKFNEDELTQARTIADYQKGIAKEIAEVNRIHAKTVGEIQKDYAKAVAKIIEEGSGKAGKRLGIAGQLVANALERSSLNAIRLSVGAEPVPTPSGYRSGKPVYGAGPQPPTPFTTLDETRYRLLKQLQSRNPAGASATADRFFTAFANRSEYENVADLRNLPVQRMQQKDFEGAYLRKRRFPNIASISSDTYPLLAGLRIGDPVPFVQPKGAAATTETRTRSKQAGEADIEATKRAEITALFTSSLGPSEQLTQSLKDQNAELAKQFDFLARGINPEMSRSLTTAQLVYERGLADAEAKRQQGIAEGFSVDLITEEYDNQVAALSRAYDINAGLIQQEDQRRKLIEDINKSTRSRFKGGLQQYYDSVSDLGTQLSNVVTNTFQGLEDQLTAFVTTGKMNFTDLANSIIADMTRILIRQIVIAPLLKGVGNLLNIKLNANGAAYAANGIVPFATGGIVSRPTFFRYANGGVPGTGLMGEAGPEAIMPLRRLPSGRLGVESAGGGTNVTVNVDATGSSVQGDSTQGAALGRAIAAAVQAELVNQKRRGGLLNS